MAIRDGGGRRAGKARRVFRQSGLRSVLKMKTHGNVFALCPIVEEPPIVIEALLTFTTQTTVDVFEPPEEWFRNSLSF